MVRILFVGICTVLAATLAAGAARVQHDSGTIVAIRDVTVIPVGTTGDRQLENMTVLVSGDRIRAIGPAPEVAIPNGALQIDGRGKFLIPGLIDLHVHLSKTRASAMRLLVANGVTTVRDMGGDSEELTLWRRDIESGKRVGPRIVMAGPYLESTRNIERMRKDPPEARVEPFERTRIGVGSPEEARRTIASVAQRSVDFIKIRTVANPETYVALNEAADAHGIRLVGHVTGLSPQAVLAAGQDGIDHFFYPSVGDDTERRALWQEFARRGVPIVPTLSVLTQVVFVPTERLRAIVNDDAGAIEPRRRFISKYLVSDWREQVAETTDERKAAQEKIWNEVIRRDLREMHAAGMEVLVGTDTAVLNIYPGFSLHDEMGRFVTELGIPPFEVLERATRRSAQFLRVGDIVGTIERGKVADLLLLDGNPIADIRNTARIAAVVVRGRVFDREALESLKAEVRSAPDVKADDWGRKPKR